MPFEKRTEIRNPELLKRIYELRNEGSGFNNITKVISTEFNIEITHPTAKNLYYEYAAKQNIKKQTGEEVDKDFEKILNDKFERIERITSSLLDAVETIKDGMDAEMYLKHAPTIISARIKPKPVSIYSSRTKRDNNKTTERYFFSYPDNF